MLKGNGESSGRLSSAGLLGCSVIPCRAIHFGYLELKHYHGRCSSVVRGGSRLVIARFPCIDGLLSDDDNGAS